MSAELNHLSGIEISQINKIWSLAKERLDGQSFIDGMIRQERFNGFLVMVSCGIVEKGGVFLVETISYLKLFAWEFCPLSSLIHVMRIFKSSDSTPLQSV